MDQICYLSISSISFLFEYVRICLRKQSPRKSKVLWPFTWILAIQKQEKNGSGDIICQLILTGLRSFEQSTDLNLLVFLFYKWFLICKGDNRYQNYNAIPNNECIRNYHFMTVKKKEESLPWNSYIEDNTLKCNRGYFLLISLIYWVL